MFVIFKRKPYPRVWFSLAYGFLFLVISISGSASSGLKHIKSLADIRLLNWISVYEWMPSSCSPAKHVRGGMGSRKKDLYIHEELGGGCRIHGA
jgi:hypothetical protein